MVRPIKQGLDYFPMDVAFLTESKVWLIKQKCGLGATDILMTLLSRIYGEEGYFMAWNAEVLDLVAYHGQVSHQQVLNVVEKALAVGFFDLETFRRHRILTSVDIQKKFVSATRRRKTVFLHKEYLLISESERENLVIGDNFVATEIADDQVAEDFSQMVQQTADTITGYEAAIGALLQEGETTEACIEGKSPEDSLVEPDADTVGENIPAVGTNPVVDTKSGGAGEPITESETAEKVKRSAKMPDERDVAPVGMGKSATPIADSTNGETGNKLMAAKGLAPEDKAKTEQRQTSQLPVANQGVRESSDAGEKSEGKPEPLVLQKTVSFALWQQLWAGPNVATQAELTRLLRNYGDPLVAAVLKIASVQQIASSCSVPFVKGYLKRWQQAGVTNVAQARAYERQCLQKNEEKQQQLAQAQQQAAAIVKNRWDQRNQGKKTSSAKNSSAGNKGATTKPATRGKASGSYGREGRPFRRQEVEDWSAYPEDKVDRQCWLKMLKKMQQLTSVMPQESDSYQLTEAELAWIHDETQGYEAAVYRQAAGVWE